MRRRASASVDKDMNTNAYDDVNVNDNVQGNDFGKFHAYPHVPFKEQYSIKFFSMMLKV